MMPPQKEKNLKFLNDLIFSGLNLIPFLLNINLKFRIHEIAFTSDTEKAFLNINIDKDD